MNVSIKRARLIEFDWPDYRGQPTTPRITAMRNARGDAFDFLAIDGVVVGDEYSDCVREDDIAVGGKNIVVFDQFPVTLADLLPEGCTEFRCKTNGFGHLVATQLPSGSWAVSSHTSSFLNLDVLAQAYRIDLDTVIPLTVDPDWIEAQR